jgi:hypothetical protein
MDCCRTEHVDAIEVDTQSLFGAVDPPVRAIIIRVHAAGMDVGIGFAPPGPVLVCR